MRTTTISPQALRLALAADRVARAIEAPFRRLQLAMALAARAGRQRERGRLGKLLLAGAIRWGDKEMIKK